MTRAGIIPEDATTELLGGMIVHVDRSTQGGEPWSIDNDHVVAVENLSNLRGLINTGLRHVRSQQPLACGDDQEPIPDFFVLRGTLHDYADTPNASDAFCVVEVADSSYERDAGIKLAGYARAGVRQYIILNLRNRTAEIYADADSVAGTYRTKQSIANDGVMPLRIGEEERLDVPLVDVLP